MTATVNEEDKEEPPLPPGTILDARFEIVERLGGGQFGHVYRAKQVVLGRKLRDVALKVFKAGNVTAANLTDVFNDAITLIGFQEENPSAEVASRMIQIYDIGLFKTPVERAFMSMKLVPGRKTLQNPIIRWKNTGMAVATSLTYLRHILVPLAWMHSLDPAVVHGDLKPDNVLLTEDFQLIVTDFGLAAPMPLGSVGGAIQYQAPETLAGSLAGSSALTAHPSADIYALGIMWYEMLTGHHPFENATLGIVYKEDPRAYLRAHYQMRQWEIRPARFASGFKEEERIVPASEINDELRHHPQLEAMLNRCLSARQSDRYQNARLLLNELDRYVETGAVSTGTGAIEPATDKKNAQAISLPTKTPEMLVKDAESLLKQGQHGAAIEKADEALKNKPRLISAMLIKARVLIAMKRIEEATACLNSASEEGGENPDLCAALAEFYTAINKPSAAADYRLMEQQLRKKQGQQSRR